MKFNNPIYENEELAYQDVFLFQQYFDWISRLKDTDIIPTVSFGTSIPIVTANMNAVTWKRMAETIARYGWLGVLPQDMNYETMAKIITKIKSANVKFDTALTMKVDNTVRDALWIINKRAHDCVVMIDDDNKPISLFKTKDLIDVDQFANLWELKKSSLITWNDDITNEEAFNLMDNNLFSSLPIIDKNGKLVWILTKKNTIRNAIYKPTLDKNYKLDVAVALGINNFLEKTRKLIWLWITIFVLDTAHGFQKTMLDAIKTFRHEFGKDLTLIAWNVCTAEWTKALLEAWANWVKVWIWPWAMCTTRMNTWVGRPQFTAVYKCSKIAREMWGFVRADGWIKDPRDLALALAAWASHGMLWTILSWTFESTGEIKYDNTGNMYKENYGMASWKAVNLRNKDVSKFELEQKALFREGISTSTIYIKSWSESVLNIIDDFTSWLRSSMTYVWAKNLKEFCEKAVIGVQTNAWYFEGTPHGRVMK